MHVYQTEKSYHHCKSRTQDQSKLSMRQFWEIPSTWRDAVAEVEQEREIEIRRKVENMYKVREAVKRKQVNSDEDDLKGWHWNSSD